MAEQGGEPVDTDGPLPDVLVAVAIGAEGDLRVVEVDAAHAAESHRVRPPAGPVGPPRRWSRTGCQTPRGAGCRGRSRAARLPRSHRGPGPALRSSGRRCRRHRRCSRGGWDSRRTRPGLVEGPDQGIGDRGEHGVEPGPPVAAEVQDEPRCAHGVRGGQVCGQARSGLGGELRVGRREVDEVARVTEGGGDRGVRGLRGPVGGEDLVAVLRRLPHPRALGVDLYDVGADRRPVLEGGHQALPRPHVRSDPHGRTVAAGPGRAGADQDRSARPIVPTATGSQGPVTRTRHPSAPAERSSASSAAASPSAGGAAVTVRQP